MCVPDLEAALCPLHGRDGGAVLRNAEGLIPENRRDLLFCLGPGENCRDLLRGGMDAALERSADHPHGSNPATLVGKYWAPGRRNSGASWPCFDSGINRYPDSL